MGEQIETALYAGRNCNAPRDLQKERVIAAAVRLCRFALQSPITEKNRVLAANGVQEPYFLAVAGLAVYFAKIARSALRLPENIFCQQG